MGSLTPTALAETTRMVARAREIEMRVAEHAKTVEVGDSVGASSTTNFWAHTTHQTRTAAHGKMRLAVALAARPALRAAVAAGEVLVEQARVIVDAVDVLPAEHRDEAEAMLMLIGFAADHDARR